MGVDDVWETFSGYIFGVVVYLGLWDFFYEVRGYLLWGLGRSLGWTGSCSLPRVP